MVWTYVTQKVSLLFDPSSKSKNDRVLNHCLHLLWNYFWMFSIIFIILLTIFDFVCPIVFFRILLPWNYIDLLPTSPGASWLPAHFSSYSITSSVLTGLTLKMTIQPFLNVQRLDNSDCNWNNTSGLNPSKWDYR